MGLDMRVITARNSRQLETEEYWDNLLTGFPEEDEYGDMDFSKPRELIYWRKFWDLYTPMCERLRLDNGDYGRLKREDVEFMLDIATLHRDYWDKFNTVPAICELLARFDDIEAQGMGVYFEGDY